MQKWKLGACVMAALALVAFAAPNTLGADDQSFLSKAKDTIGETVEIHGFGGWSYGMTDGNEFLYANEDGTWENLDFALNISARPYDKLLIVAQPNWSMDEEDTDVDLDYGFAEWAFMDELKVRAGKIKSPFGNYGEIYDVGTLRPFLNLPTCVYWPPSLVTNSYTGVGITGSHFLEDGWGLTYDLYGGEYKLEDMMNVMVSMQTRSVSRYEAEPFVDEMLGGRILVHTPVDGLSAGVSSYMGHMGQYSHGDRTEFGDTTYVVNLNTEYNQDPWLVRAEYSHSWVEVFPVMDVDNGYIEAAYKITQHWQVAARGEVSKTEFDNAMFDALYDDLGLMDHKELALGVNYWFNPSLVAKVSYHLIDGNGFAYPGDDELSGALMGGDTDETTQAVFTRGSV